MNKSVSIATAKRRWSTLCINYAIVALPAEVLTTDLDSVTLSSYSCSVVTTAIASRFSYWQLYDR